MRTKYVNKDWLEAKVKDINDELINFHHETAKRQRLEAARNYYVGKRIDMDEYDLQTIDIECYEKQNNS